jgi:outer membrane protein assembly factor BamD
VLAKLRIADAHFGDEAYLEAIESYRAFIKLHPKHPKVHYATFSAARCYYERMPEEWFFLPPVSEKDQTHTIDAQNALQDFIARFPKSEHVPEAKELLAQAQERLIAHERYAAAFYARHDRWRAVAWRSLAMAERFPESPEAARALLRAGEAYEELGEGKAALRAYRLLLEKYPKSEAAADARERIDEGIEHPEQDERLPEPPAREAG